MDCIGTNPNIDLFICVNGGWVPKTHEIAIQRTAAPSTNDFQPPTSDEYEEVEVYPGTGGPKTKVRVRTSNPDDWFVDGKTYRHPYGFVAKVDGVALRLMDGTWRWCHRLVITESAGDPEVGYVVYARLFASRANWEEVTR